MGQLNRCVRGAFARRWRIFSLSKGLALHVYLLEVLGIDGVVGVLVIPRVGLQHLVTPPKWLFFARSADPDAALLESAKDRPRTL